jgi:equilibrative nucleoside transporter 1/2/3
MAIVSSLIGSVEKSRSMILKSTVIYFGSSVFVLALTIVGFYWLSRQEVYTSALANFKPEPASIRKNISAFKTGVKLVWDLAIGVMMALTVTIAVITSYIPNAQSTVTSGLWPSIYLSVVFLVFSIGDVTGRWLPAFKSFTFRRRSRKPLAIPWIRLFVFVPLFLMSNMRGEFTGLRSHLPTIIRSDWLYMIVIFFFGLTSGYSTTTFMMIAPEQSERKYLEQYSDLPDGVEEAKGASGTIMGLFINFGLVLGSMGSFILRLLL